MKHNLVFSDGLVTLKPLNIERDFSGIMDVFKDEKMHLYIGNNILRTSDEAKKQLKIYIESEFIYSWGIFLNDKEFIGTYWICIPSENEDKKLIITDEAQRISVKYWRKGITKRARNLIYDYCFNTLNVYEIRAHAFNNNKNSCISMEKSGFKLLEQYREYFKKQEKELTMNHYYLNKENWINHNN
ncbi:GNAT family N-acetyltransferase [Paraclostridium bifermentans]|uniref:GNAT family N-acetyltransferase n=1 Tax=Paraclostridium bifermentans TaxID=1490 RepID=UPI00359C7D25